MPKNQRNLYQSGSCTMFIACILVVLSGLTPSESKSLLLSSLKKRADTALIFGFGYNLDKNFLLKIEVALDYPR